MAGIVLSTCQDRRTDSVVTLRRFAEVSKQRAKPAHEVACAAMGSMDAVVLTKSNTLDMHRYIHTYMHTYIRECVLFRFGNSCMCLYANFLPFLSVCLGVHVQDYRYRGQQPHIPKYTYLPLHLLVVVASVPPHGLQSDHHKRADQENRGDYRNVNVPKLSSQSTNKHTIA